MMIFTESSFASRLAEAIDALVSDGIIINPAEMIIQLVATIALILVVKFYFWDKITAFLEARQAVVDHELTEANEQNAEAKSIRIEAEKTLEQAKQEAKMILAEAKTRGEDTRRSLIAKAKDEATHIKKSAQKDLAQDIAIARANIRNEIIDIATVLTEKAIAAEIDQKVYDRLIDDAIEAVQKQ